MKKQREKNYYEMTNLISK